MTATLSKTTEEVSIIGGVGEFSSALEPLEVEESIAAQYDTEEMQAAGWSVKWDTAGTSEPSSPAEPELPSEPDEEEAEPEKPTPPSDPPPVSASTK